MNFPCHLNSVLKSLQMDQNVIRNLAIIQYMHSFKGQRLCMMVSGLVGQVMVKVMKLWHLCRVGHHRIFIYKDKSIYAFFQGRKDFFHGDWVGWGGHGEGNTTLASVQGRTFIEYLLMHFELRRSSSRSPNVTVSVHQSVCHQVEIQPVDTGMYRDRHNKLQECMGDGHYV